MKYYDTETKGKFVKKLIYLILILFSSSINAAWRIAVDSLDKFTDITDDPYSFYVEDIPCFVEKTSIAKQDEGKFLETRTVFCKVTNDTAVHVLGFCNPPYYTVESFGLTKSNNKTHFIFIMCGKY